MRPLSSHNAYEVRLDREKHFVNGSMIDSRSKSSKAARSADLRFFEGRGELLLAASRALADDCTSVEDEEVGSGAERAWDKDKVTSTG